MVLANSGRCLKTHALECVGSEGTDNNRINQHFTPIFQPKKRRKITLEDKLEVKEAAISFVVSDLRPISAVNGTGLANLLSKMTKIGAKYGEMTEEDLEQCRIVPSRQSVRKCYSHRKILAYRTHTVPFVDFQLFLEPESLEQNYSSGIAVV